VTAGDGVALDAPVAEVTVLDAPVAEVTVLEDRARVIRRGVVSLPVGQTRLVVRGVAPVLVDKTLTARASSGRVLDARCRRRLAPWRTGEGGGDAARSRAAAALADELAAAGAALGRIDAELAAAAGELADLVGLRGVVLAELAGESAWARLPADAAERLATIDERERQLTAAVVARRADRERAHRDRTALEARAAEAQRDAGVEVADVELDVALAEPAEVTIALDYLVPGACWRPYHTATLADGTVTLVTDACVWQHTGEDWREATLSCSTERPSLGAEPPRLVADELRVQRRREALVVEARDHDVDTTGLGVDRAVQTAAEVPGVDDGGVAQTLRAPHPATVPSDGLPYRVTLGSHQAAAEIALVAFPERSPCAFTRTRQANGGRPLLAGPVDLIRDAGYVGRTALLYVAPGERFELGWGPEPDVRLHRTEDRHRDEAGMLGSWHETRVRVAVRLSNLGERARALEVTERVPVSELDKVEIRVAAADAWRPEEDGGLAAPAVTARTIDDDGLVRWQVELPPHERRLVALEYRIRSHTSVVGL
jgi:uncharacterized protein (TIGR02231 family)